MNIPWINNAGKNLAVLGLVAVLLGIGWIFFGSAKSPEMKAQEKAAAIADASPAEHKLSPFADRTVYHKTRQGDPQTVYCRTEVRKEGEDARLFESEWVSFDGQTNWEVPEGTRRFAMLVDYSVEEMKTGRVAKAGEMEVHSKAGPDGNPVISFNPTEVEPGLAPKAGHRLRIKRAKFRLYEKGRVLVIPIEKAL